MHKELQTVCDELDAIGSAHLQIVQRQKYDVVKMKFTLKNKIEENNFNSLKHPPQKTTICLTHYR